MPAPPPIFSTMTFFPRIPPIAWAWSRGEVSTARPGVNGTTSVRVRVGHSCAMAGGNVARAKRNPKTMRDIAFSIVLGDIISAPLVRCYRPGRGDRRAGPPTLAVLSPPKQPLDIRKLQFHIGRAAMIALAGMRRLLHPAHQPVPVLRPPPASGAHRAAARQRGADV